MPAPQPSLSTRARWIIGTQLAAVRPGRKHTPGIHTRATGFLPFTSPARGAVAVAFREARREAAATGVPATSCSAWPPQDQGTAARALRRLGISREHLAGSAHNEPDPRRWHRPSPQ